MGAVREFVDVEAFRVGSASALATPDLTGLGAFDKSWRSGALTVETARLPAEI